MLIPHTLLKMNTFASAMHTLHSFQFEQRINDFIAHHSLMSDRQSVIVALSGGADSVALMRVLRALNYKCKAAHCNFHLRGDESDRDERFVRDLCATLAVPLFVRHFDVHTYMAENGVSLEMACRGLRYAWFKDLLKELRCEKLAVAHHLNDNVETFFLNALRGAGIKGLSGMPVKNGAVIRPMLCVSRQEVLDYLRSLGQAYVTDSTNLENDVKRNKLRNVILPQVERYFPDANAQFGKTIDHTRSCNALYVELVEHVKKNVCDSNNSGVLTIDIAKLLRFENNDTLLFEILKPYGFNYSQCADALRSVMKKINVGKHFYSSSFTLAIRQSKFEVYIHQSILQDTCSIDLSSRIVQYPIKIKIDIVKLSEDGFKKCDGKNVIALNLGVLKAENVVVRRWKAGDRFRPFGMKGRKLLSDLFTDLKLGEREKNDVWIMEADGEIIWVIGYRASALYKVSATDDSYLMLSVSR